MELLYKVGDKVRVRRDLKTGDYRAMVSCRKIDEGSGDMYVNEHMAAKAGRVVTIKAISPNSMYEYIYKIEEDGWAWTDEMFEAPEKTSIRFAQLL